jgi:hypothetical protein
MGSLSGVTSAAMRASLIMKFVAQVSSSMMRQLQPASTASCMLAAWLVLPLASSDWKEVVDLKQVEQQQAQ